jgi:hypothetical protein
MRITNIFIALIYILSRLILKYLKGWPNKWAASFVSIIDLSYLVKFQPSALPLFVIRFTVMYLNEGFALYLSTLSKKGLSHHSSKN